MIAGLNIGECPLETLLMCCVKKGFLVNSLKQYKYIYNVCTR